MAFYTIHPRDIQNICFQKRARVVDIRNPQEYRKYHYKGASRIVTKTTGAAASQKTVLCFCTVSMEVQVFLLQENLEKKGMRFTR